MQQSGIALLGIGLLSLIIMGMILIVNAYGIIACMVSVSVLCILAGILLIRLDV